MKALIRRVSPQRVDKKDRPYVWVTAEVQLVCYDLEKVINLEVGGEYDIEVNEASFGKITEIKKAEVNK